MMFFIIWGSITLIGVGVGFLYWKMEGSYVSDLFFLIIGGVVGVVAGALIAVVVCTAGSNHDAKDNRFKSVESEELVALATHQEDSGEAGFMVFVGWSQQDETRMAYWTAMDDEGIVQMHSDEATDILIRETNEAPRYITQEQIDDSHFWYLHDRVYTTRYLLEVPEGTLLTNYEFQP